VAHLTGDGHWREFAQRLADDALGAPPNHPGSLFKGEPGAWLVGAALESGTAAPDVPVLGPA
jgi:hypothetical protein